jgi:hypothetical protein
LKPAHLCHDRKEVESELKKVKLPSNFRCVLTGFGKVGHGAREIVSLLPIKEVSAESFLNDTHDQPVFTHLDTHQYFARKADNGFDKADFYANPENYKSNFAAFSQSADMYIPCHFWSAKSPLILTQDMLRSAQNRIKLVADISCDIAGPIACTIRPSKIGNSYYGYDPQTGLEVPFDQAGAIAVMAVDNLPCELPKDASIDFAKQLLNNVFPALLGEDPDQIIYRASETTVDGQLNEPFLYLQDYLNESH